MKNVTKKTAAANVSPAALLAQHLADLETMLDKRKGFEDSVYGMRYHMVATMVEVAVSAHADSQYREALLKACDDKNVKLPDASKNENAYLHIVRLADGEVVTRTNRAGISREEWKPDRSNEKYARAVRWFVKHGFNRAKVIQFLSGDKPFATGTTRVKPNLTAVINADRKDNPPRKVNLKASAEQDPVATAEFLSELKTQAATMLPLLRMKMDYASSQYINWVNSEFAVVVVRRGQGEMHVLGDAGIEPDKLNALLAKNVATFAMKNKAAWVDREERTRSVEPADKHREVPLSLPAGAASLEDGSIDEAAAIPSVKEFFDEQR